jgi:hypothetical protein
MTATTPPTNDAALPPGPTIGNYAKAINSTIILSLGALGAAFQDGSINTTEWLMILIAFLGGVSTVAVPLRYSFLRGYGKLGVTALTAAVTQLITALQDGGGVSSAEWVFVLTTFFMSIGSVWASPNAALSDALRNTVNPATGFARRAY